MGRDRPDGRSRRPNIYTSGYLVTPVTPQFPFGHGLSYSRFEFGNLRTASTNFGKGETITIEADVTNAGAMSGEETVLLFVRDVVARLAPPVMELRGTTKVTLAPGASGTVRFDLPVTSLAFPGGDLGPEVEAGEFELMVGSSADPSAVVRTRIKVSG